MNIHTYKRAGGKDVIYEYIDKLSTKQRQIGYLTIEKLQEKGLQAVETKPLREKL